MSDKSILEHITALVAEEHALREGPLKGDAEAERMRQLETQLDQCWDLLRQRRAKREFGQDASEARVRDPKTVEGYEG
jgi:hypothetical protein